MSEQHFVTQAKFEIARILTKWIEDNCEGSVEVKPTDIYTVWLSKVLQNNKGLFSTDLIDDVYFEVTYNGSKNELYIDQYHKIQNICLQGDEL